MQDLQKRSVHGSNNSGSEDRRLLMQKFRIYELAKSYAKTSEEIISILKKNNIDATSNFSSVDETAKNLLDRTFAPKPEKKPFKHSGMRTVRFDQQGKPKAASQVSGRPGESKTPQRPAVSAHEKETATVSRTETAAPVQSKEQESVRGQAPQHTAGSGHVPQHAGHDQPRRAENGEHRQAQSASGSDRPQRTEHGRERYPRSHDRPQGQGRPTSDRNNRGEGRPNGPTRQRPAGGPGNRPGAHPGNHPGNRPGNHPANRPGSRDGKPAAAAQSQTARPHDKPSHRKNKKDYERSRREREGTSLMAQSMKMGRKKRHVSDRKPAAAAPTEVQLPPSITVKGLAELFGREVSEIIKHLMSLGVMATINQNVDPDAAALLADEFGITLLEPEKQADPTAYEPAPDDPKLLKHRAPVVTIMGHVDHGKTTLLDAIRSTSVASHEAGGITQRIGAYQIRYKNQKITFLDTPGHAAFTAMRTRGAQITDIAVIIVAADDGVMPQTLEAIHHAKDAKVPILVAINKIDMPGANPEHIKEQLSHEGLISEEWGGDTIMVPISAKKKIGLENLLDSILLVAEMQELKADPTREAYGVVVEAQLDKGRGPVMTVLVQNGTLHVGDGVLAGKCWGKVRAMTNENGRRMDKAEPSSPAEILGMSDVPDAGDHFYVMDDKKAREIAALRAEHVRAEEQSHVEKITLDNIFQKIEEGEMKELNLVIKADVQGSVEALLQSFEGIKSSQVRISIIHAAVGAINESDVMLASASNALIIGFNVRPDANARKISESEKVDVRLYRVIYDAIDDVKAAMTGLLAPKIKEILLGHAEVRQIIRTPKVIVAGSYVQDGKITNSCQIRLIRDGIVVHEGQIASLRRFKDDVKEVAEGFECGIAIDSYRDVKEGDVIEAFTLEETAAQLE